MLILFCLAVFFLFLLFWFRPSWGLYAAVFLAPFLGLILDFSHFEWAQNLPYLKNIDAPLADFIVLILFGAVAMKMVWRRATMQGRPYDLGYWLRGVGFFYFLPFLLAGLLSLFNVPYDQFNGSLKYLLRPILFFYLIWVFLPIILIDSEKKLNRAIKILFWTGVLSALMGLISLFIAPAIFGFWHRAGPIELWGLAPLAFNHNLLAEWLVVVAPLAFWLYAVETPQRGVSTLATKFYFFAFILTTAIALLTFARAAWLALAAELAVYWLVRKRESDKFYPSEPPFRSGTIISLTVIVLPLLIYMLLFSFSPMVRSSNATRLDLTGISWTYFKLHPWLGNGAGTFIPLVEQTRLFTVEYGDPLDAHGILQKLAAEQGLLGWLTFSFFVGWIVYRLFRASRRAAKEHRLLLLCLFLSVVGGLVYQLFNTSYYNAHLWLPVGVALAGAKIFKKY